MGPVDMMTHKVEVLHGHCDAVGRDIAEIEFTLGVKVTIRDSEAEADRVWKAAMEHNRTPMARVADDDTFWNGTPEQIAERLRPYVELGFRTVISRAAGAVRRRDVRALHRRGQAARRRRLEAFRYRRPGRRPGSVLIASRATRTSPSMPISVRRLAIPDAGRRAVGGGRVADRGVVERVGDELVDRRLVPSPSERSVGRWPTSRRSLSMARWRRRRPSPRLGASRRRRARSRPGRAPGRESRGRSQGPRAGPPRGPCPCGEPRRASRSHGRAHGRARRPCRSPGRRRPGATPSASASAPRGPRRRRRHGQPRADRPDDAEGHRLRERVRVRATAAIRASGSSRRCRSRPSRPAAGRRSAPGRGSWPSGSSDGWPM